MRRLAFGAALLSAVLAAGALSAATPGSTLAERRLALELQRRLLAKKTPKVARPVARTFAVMYLRRAHVLDVRPAEELAARLLATDLRVRKENQPKYFAWALDALVRGAGLKDLKTTIKDLLGATYSRSDRALFIELCLRNASRYASPLPLVGLAAKASDNGIVGRRRRDLMTWAADRVKRGEDPAYIERIYEAFSSVEPSPPSQVEFLKKCYRVVRLGVPPRALADLVGRLAKKYDTGRSVEEDLDKVLNLFFAGKSFEEATDSVLPPPKLPPK